ncbi:SRPBCC family protein [Flexivirga caeni]|uniref:Carbon monoxide dehydrogenase n=1 Tax=Flexivirga caeni TaxID=2294115 RepID=A0A3M9MB21_9MICO|nr:SRPBCC family protein [Flexivirga caeni]RNI22770.1 carbon monoxide dehydrogenase [Flexivirga caeni]
MDLTHSFTVPAGVDETWVAFQDIESVAECFPGAQITSASGDSFEGTVKVKLGPIALVYKGTGTFTERDEEAHRMVIDAKGKDRRGNGTAGALVTATMTAVDEGTRVEVVTDLSITGKPAQFGRGVIQDVSDKLLGQFVDCLQQKVGSDGGTAESEPAAEAGGVDETEPEPAVVTPTPAPTPAPAATRAEPTDDALDLGTTVLPVMAKLYWKQAVAALAGIAVLGVLIRRLRHPNFRE